jgi:hypothetical protein
MVPARDRTSPGASPGAPPALIARRDRVARPRVPFRRLTARDAGERSESDRFPMIDMACRLSLE